MKPHIKGPSAITTLDFSSIPMNTLLELDGKKVKYKGGNFGQVWVQIGRKNECLKPGDQRIERLRLCS